MDPREFVVEVESGGKLQQPLRIKVHYFACNDSAGWCKSISQEYTVQVEVDRDGGRVQSRGRQAKRPMAGQPGTAPTGRSDTGGDESRLAGAIESIDQDSRLLTIRLRNGRVHTITVEEDADIFRDRASSKFEELKARDRLFVQLEKPLREMDKPVATRIMARSM